MSYVISEFSSNIYILLNWSVVQLNILRGIYNAGLASIFCRKTKSIKRVTSVISKMTGFITLCETDFLTINTSVSELSGLRSILNSIARAGCLSSLYPHSWRRGGGARSNLSFSWGPGCAEKRLWPMSLSKDVSKPKASGAED